MKRIPVHINPFAGRCIHGKPGAKFYKGNLISNKCTSCKKAYKLWRELEQAKNRDFVGV